MSIPPRAGDLRLSQLFPSVTDDPPAFTFELGLVLGGTVSAGAYTAGALDFLLQALEAWNANGAPPHKVIIKTAGGSSGGAVCAAILGLLSSRIVPHVKADATPPAQADNPVGTGNPLWDLWINTFRMERLLTTTDLAANRNADDGTGATVTPTQHVAALLNSEMIDAGGAALAALGNETIKDPPAALPWFAAPFRVAITVANLRGIPFKVRGIPTLANFSGTAFVEHDDFAWFAFPNGANPAATDPLLGKREDEFWLAAAPGAGFVPYDTLTAYATASGALPLGLPARALSRPAEHYWYRPKVRPVTDLPAGYRVDWPAPDWSELPDAQDGTYAFTAVDGGTFNNDPVTLVHRALAGLVGHNPRGASDANRAILMIDPLADQPTPIARTGKSLVAVIGNIVNTDIAAARYLTTDMDLFADADVYSRFQLVPFRPGTTPGSERVGEAALAGSSLFAAAGWCARPFRVHDYLLGRSNMQAYLRQELLLAGDNKLFDNWPEAMRPDYATGADGQRVAIQANTPRDSYFLPVLPDLTDDPATVPDWPVGAFNPASLTKPLGDRLQAVINKVVADNLGGGLESWLIGALGVPGIVNAVVPRLVASFQAELTEAGLWPATA